jgi:xanthine dehydrogenase large subunit
MTSGKIRGKRQGAVHTAQIHDSALKHVGGDALYIDDIPSPEGLLHGALVLSTTAHGRLISIIGDRAKTMPGVVGVFTAADIIGENDIR